MNLVHDQPIAGLVETLRSTNRVTVPSYDLVLAVQALEPRAVLAPDEVQGETTYTVTRRPMTLAEAAAAAGINVYDTALPIDWLDDASQVGDPRGHVVWSYDEERIFGKPAAVTEWGKELLDLLDRRGT